MLQCLHKDSKLLLQDLAVFGWKMKCEKVNKNKYNTVQLHTKHCCSFGIAKTYADTKN